ncbi:hypothetical protein BDQ17DRAFT_1436875 [Cyathus striatus]|nr:hypothetical protein BDQ17DRAFT_1436875 [Cyathus striatus]
MARLMTLMGGISPTTLKPTSLVIVIAPTWLLVDHGGGREKNSKIIHAGESLNHLLWKCTPNQRVQWQNKALLQGVSSGRCIKEYDERLEMEQVIEKARTSLQIKLFLFNLSNSLPYGKVVVLTNPLRQGWIESRTSTLLNHLCDCKFVSDLVKQHAIDEIEAQSGGKQGYNAESTLHAQCVQDTHYTQPLPPPIFMETSQYEFEQLVISGDYHACARARDMVAIINNSLFWQSIAWIKNHLAPLAIAANLTQSSFCRLDEVLLTFGYLTMHFSSLPAEDIDISTAVLASIERRWAQSDNDVFIAATILNPFVKLNPFHKSWLFTLGRIDALMERLWTRFYGNTAPGGLYEELRSYLEGTNDYEDLPNVCRKLLSRAISNNITPDPLQAYSDATAKI